MQNKLSITVSDNMMKRIYDYRFGDRIDKKQTAVTEILEAGLNALDAKNNIPQEGLAAEKQEDEHTNKETRRSGIR